MLDRLARYPAAVPTLLIGGLLLIAGLACSSIITLSVLLPAFGLAVVAVVGSVTVVAVVAMVNLVTAVNRRELTHLEAELSTKYDVSVALEKDGVWRVAGELRQADYVPAARALLVGGRELPLAR